MFDYTISVLSSHLNDLRAHRMTILRYSDGGSETKMADLIALEEKIQDILSSIELLKQFDDENLDENDEKLILSESEIRDICSKSCNFEMEEEFYG